MSPLSEGWGRIQLYMPNVKISEWRLSDWYDDDFGDSWNLRRLVEWAIENESSIDEFRYVSENELEPIGNPKDGDSRSESL